MTCPPKRRFILLFAIVSIATIPRGFIGYGTDGDGWRSVAAAERFVTTDHYYPSRLPGNPNFEYMLALIDPWSGNVGTNLAVFLFFVLSIWALYRVACDLNLPNTFMVTSLYALCPILLKNAVTTMDYIPGLCMLIGAYLFALRGQLMLSGILLGIAIGLRITNALFLMPVVVFLCLKGLTFRQIITVPLLAGSLGMLSFLPILLKVGLRALSIPPNMYTPSVYAARTVYQGLQLFGVIATSLIAIVTFTRLRRWNAIRHGSGTNSNASYYLELLTVVAFVGMFVIHADETEYLIPIVPFLLLICARIFSRKELILIGVFILSYGVVDIELKGGESGRRKLKPSLEWGVLVRDLKDRMDLEGLRSEIYRLGSPAKTAIVTGMGPILTYQNGYLERVRWKEELPFLRQDGIMGPFCHRVDGSSAYLLNAISQDNARALSDNGFRLRFFAESAPSVLINHYHYDPNDIGMDPITTGGKRAFWKQAVE